MRMRWTCERREEREVCVSGDYGTVGSRVGADSGRSSRTKTASEGLGMGAELGSASVGPSVEPSKVKTPAEWEGGGFKE